MAASASPSLTAEPSSTSDLDVGALRVAGYLAAFERLIEHVSLSLERLPSGVWFIDCEISRGDMIVVETHPNGRSGITLVEVNDPESTPFDGHDRVFENDEQALEHLRQLIGELREAGRLELKDRPRPYVRDERPLPAASS